EQLLSEPQAREMPETLKAKGDVILHLDREIAVIDEHLNELRKAYHQASGGNLSRIIRTVFVINAGNRKHLNREIVEAENFRKKTAYDRDKALRAFISELNHWVRQNDKHFQAFHDVVTAHRRTAYALKRYLIHLKAMKRAGSVAL